METNIQELEQLLEYKFSKQKDVLQALTHPSFEHEQTKSEGGDYQRLEFFGDAVLGMLLAEMLYSRFTDRSEGDLSRFRSQMADQDTLAEIARKLGLGRFIRLGRGETLSSGQDKDSILADVLESLIAAIYLDGGLGAARALVDRLFGDIIDTREGDFKINDAKSGLQELLSALHLPPPCYRLLEESGPPHARVFRFQVQSGDYIGTGEGRSKKAAQQAAAAEALEKLKGDGGCVF